MRVLQRYMTTSGVWFYEIDQITTQELPHYRANSPGVMQIRYLDWPGEFWFLHRGMNSSDPAWRAETKQTCLQYIGELDATDTRPD